MTKRTFRSTVCNFSKELRHRQIIRGFGLTAIATLIITAHLQQIGRIHSLPAINLPSAPAISQNKISSYLPQTVAAVSQVPAANKNLSAIVLPPHWSIESINVKGSFNNAAHQAGLTHAEIIGLKQIFSDKIDYSHLRNGDRFRVITERIPAVNPSDKPIDKIIAADFSTAHTHYTLIRYKNTKTQQVNYYQPNGDSLSLGFLRCPVHYTRIGSGFLLHRLDPVSGVYHSHPAIDFDAPMNTPIVATADGKISFITTERGYGNVIKIDHAGHVMTLYAHMRGFAKGLHRGSAVKKGQLIGYVGMTGYTTGPHVHYELHFGSRPVNPLTAQLPSAANIAPDQKALFNKQENEVMRYLNRV
jgi:murein DD-endopeptidase MepM/ murein hydrolase activator NlpD